MTSTASLVLSPSASRLPHCRSCPFKPKPLPLRKKVFLKGRNAGEDDDDDYHPSMWAALLEAEASKWEEAEGLDEEAEKKNAHGGLFGAGVGLDRKDKKKETADEEHRRRRQKADQMLCSSQKCRTWFDLRSWFGLEDKDLSDADFEACFIPVTKDGIGLFEHFVELGKKTLETTAEMFFFHHFNVYEAPQEEDYGSGVFSSSLRVNENLEDTMDFIAPPPLPVPSDLGRRLTKKHSVLQLAYTEKHTERTTSPLSLYKFGCAYLAGAQGLNTRTSVVDYVRACIGYSCCCSSSSFTPQKSVYVWTSSLIKHIYWTQRVTSGETREESWLIQDLQEYLGYNYVGLTRAVRECLGGSRDASITSAPPGDRLLRVYLQDYFEELAQGSSIPPEDVHNWVSREVDHFFESCAIPLFASAFLSLSPFLAEGYEMLPGTAERGSIHKWHGLPGSHVYVETFMCLLSISWRHQPEDRAKIWMKSLIQRLRQLQLTVEVVRLDRQMEKGRGRHSGRRRGGTNSGGVDIRRYHMVREGLLGKYLVWTRAFAQAERKHQTAREAARASRCQLIPSPEALALFAREDPHIGKTALGSGANGSSVCPDWISSLLPHSVSSFFNTGVTKKTGVLSESSPIFPPSYGIPRRGRGFWQLYDREGNLKYELMLAGGPVNVDALKALCVERDGENHDGRVSYNLSVNS